jgi:hypothetical protein
MGGSKTELGDHDNEPMRYDRRMRIDLRGVASAAAAFALAAALPVLGCKSGRGRADGTGGETTAGTGGAGVAGGAGAGGGASGGGGAGGAGGAGGVTSSNPCATAIFCDDFESYPTGQAPGGNWTAQLGGGTVAVDGAQFRSGARSVKFTTPVGTGFKSALIRLAGAAIFPVTGNVFYGRMMFQLQAAPTGDVHWTMIQGGGLVAGQNYHALYRYGGQHPVTQGATFLGSQLMANYDTPDSYPIGSGTPPASDCWQHANKTVIPVGRWTCVEWKFDGPNNQMSLWLDGVAVPELTVNGSGQGCVNQPATPPFTWTAPTFDRLDLGWESYQSDDARTAWVDDVVIARDPIGCP